ncbi:hypothetical protein [Bradyrhizobium sp. LHD-71]|uniref:hypothetical protein n=1 Tax=Bradyrhizobium sp. LHD-71 TaxID=3072141 RepID=UPI00280FD7F7|nr:hypothetical protein [Bradyrhizobium sp. LHD-71]MDQ8730519.1 hypothetical protein [Bradyrhizobium sp. LHD-71]
MLQTGASVWLTTSDNRQPLPPAGAELPIVLGDATLIMSTVLSSSPSAIVIELDCAHLRRLTPARGRSANPASFPGSEWIVQLRV